VDNMPTDVKRQIERYREACTVVNGEEWASRLSATYNHGWIHLELASSDPSWEGPEWYKSVRRSELAQMTYNLQQQAMDKQEPSPGPLKVTVQGSGDPEVFIAKYVRIACDHGIFRIKFSKALGLRISAEDGSLDIRPVASNAVLLKEYG